MKGGETGFDRRGFLRLLSASAVGVAAWSHASGVFAETLTRTTRKSRLVMLDPGHGGIDPGAIGVSGIYEKNIAFATAHEVGRLLEATGRYRVRLTRSGDQFVPLGERVERAQAAGADLFLSIHADAIPDSSIRGASVFTLSEKASDAEAAALAAHENKSDLIAGVDLSRHEAVVSEILFDLARRQTNNLSLRLARELVAELAQEVPLLNNTHRSAGFAVLKAPDIPSALVELGCLSNTQEERALRQISYQHKLAQSIVRSIADYFERV